MLQGFICILEFRFYCKLKVTLGVKLIVNFSNVQLNVAWTKNLAARHIAMTKSKCKRYQKMKSKEEGWNLHMFFLRPLILGG